MVVKAGVASLSWEAKQPLSPRRVHRPRKVVQSAGCLFALVNCWPSESGSGCEVNIEYELQEESLELNDVTIIIPLP